jgi:two-component system, NtrC family, sensor histidine kinase HydH
MNSRLLWRVTAPAVAVGLVLLAAGVAAAWYINRLQTRLADVLNDNVTSLRAAQELEICVRQLRFHNLMYLMDPGTPRWLKRVEDDERQFLDALESARRTARTPEEKDCIRSIATAYEQYQDGQKGLRAAGVKAAQAADFPKLVDTHPVKRVVDPCQELLRINKEEMDRTAAESQRVSQMVGWAMLALGLAGPVGGLVMGFGVARGLKKSLYRLSVRVQDVAQRLDRDVASVSIAADGDLNGLDRQLQYIVGRVEEVAGRLRQQQRELVRAEQLSAVGQLAASVAHEVRNPLTGIKMLVEAALRPRSPGRGGVTPPLLTDEDLRVIHGEVVRLEQTVQHLLTFARLPAPQRAPCDLREVVGQARDLVRARAEQQRVEVRVRVPDRPVVAAVDRGQISTVLVNLFLNALDAMPGGGRLDVRLEMPTTNEVRFTVNDSGGGIPAKIAERLFTPFATTKPTGTGLGLSLSKRILEEHGGAITAANRPEGGACFVLTLPASEPEARRDPVVGR